LKTAEAICTSLDLKRTKQTRTQTWEQKLESCWTTIGVRQTRKDAATAHYVCLAVESVEIDVNYRGFNTESSWDTFNI